DDTLSLHDALPISAHRDPTGGAGMRRLARALLLGAVLCGPVLPAAADGLQPYQMIRSLQLLQDGIADGDHADLPMQTRLLAIIDKRLKETAPEDFDDPRNLRALLVYG